MVMLNDIEISGVDVKVYPVQDYRFVLVLHGEDLDDKISETDPQMVGVMPLEARALNDASERAAAHVRAFVTAAGEVLREREYANMAMLRGILAAAGTCRTLESDTVSIRGRWRRTRCTAGWRRLLGCG